MAGRPTPRAVSRRSFDTGVRLTLAEDDLDEGELSVAAVREEFQKSVEDLRREIAATRQVLTGILVALVVASIMLAINLAVSKVGAP